MKLLKISVVTYIRYYFYETSRGQFRLNVRKSQYITTKLIRKKLTINTCLFTLYAVQTIILPCVCF